MTNVKALKKELIVVDPHPDDYRSMLAHVESELRVQYATSGEETLRLVSGMNEPLWLINTELPDMKGLELFSLLKQRNPRLQGVLVGDKYSELEELTVRRSGINLYVCKPIELAWFQAILASHKPVLRDHYAHAPPGSKALTAQTDVPIITPTLQVKPDS